MQWKKLIIRNVLLVLHVKNPLAQVHFMLKKVNRIVSKVIFFSKTEKMKRKDVFSSNVDYRQLFQAKCTGCDFPIEPGDKYLEAMSGTFHVECFNCSVRRLIVFEDQFSNHFPSVFRCVK